MHWKSEVSFISTGRNIENAASKLADLKRESLSDHPSEARQGADPKQERAPDHLAEAKRRDASREGENFQAVEKNSEGDDEADAQQVGDLAERKKNSEDEDEAEAVQTE
jgi:hypothetical protein